MPTRERCATTLLQTPGFPGIEELLDASPPPGSGPCATRSPLPLAEPRSPPSPWRALCPRRGPAASTASRGKMDDARARPGRPAGSVELAALGHEPPRPLPPSPACLLLENVTDRVVVVASAAHPAWAVDRASTTSTSERNRPLPALVPRPVRAVLPSLLPTCCSCSKLQRPPPGKGGLARSGCSPPPIPATRRRTSSTPPTTFPALQDALMRVATAVIPPSPTKQGALPTLFRPPRRTSRGPSYVGPGRPRSRPARPIRRWWPPAAVPRAHPSRWRARCGRASEALTGVGYALPG